ncbi:MAG: hypothetical protein FJW88_01205 [Actinobacteria bacterium]|nr:hypothetical protein [Actinomycetota bacterium]
MAVDPRTPVIVGTGQVSQREADPAAALEPVDLLATAARAADADARARRSLLDTVDTIAVVDILSWKYPDPGALLARRLGIEPRRTVTTTVGGNSPQMLVNRLGDGVQRGEHDVVLLGGTECMYTRWRARRADPKTWLPWEQPDDPPCPDVRGDDRPGSSAFELAHLALAPTQVYPLFETARRALLGHGLDEHQRHVARLWSHFASAAADNPHAWSRTPYSPDDLRTVSPDNRMVVFPYPKRLCANIDVDQAAAMLLCSYQAARDAGVPDGRMVFLRAGADAHDTYFFSERVSLAESQAIGIAGRAAVEAAGVTLDDVARFDLYSCFPSAVQAAMGSLGLVGPDGGDTRPLTVTGGLGFAGGPGNNYVTHSIAAMVDACRADPGALGLVTALGWYVTKHSVGVYSATPGPDGFRVVDPRATQGVVDVGPTRAVTGPYAGDAVVEATSVAYERDGTPSLGILAALTVDGRRALAISRDADALASMCAEAWEGRSVTLRPDGDTNHLG